jgi:hypothetical protein
MILYKANGWNRQNLDSRERRREHARAVVHDVGR